MDDAECVAADAARELSPVNKNPTFPSSLRLGRCATDNEKPMPLMGSSFLVATLFLTIPQRAIYINLLAYWWTNEQGLDDNDDRLARIAGVSRASFRKNFRPIAHEYFQIADGKWHPNAGHIYEPKSRRPTPPDWAFLRRSIFERDRYTCTYCGQVGGELECDHMIPVSRGGSNDIENLTTACKPCNRAKGAMTVEEWRGVSA